MYARQFYKSHTVPLKCILAPTRDALNAKLARPAKTFWTPRSVTRYCCHEVKKTEID